MNIAQRIQKGITDDIKLHGIAVMSVFGDETNPPMAYTIGMANYNLPDYVVFGLPLEVAHFTLMILVDHVKLHGCAPPNGEVIRELGDLPVCVKNIPLDVALNYTVQAGEFYKNNGISQFSFQQLIWPDEHGQFPWDANFDKKYIKSQPTLWVNLH